MLTAGTSFFLCDPCDSDQVIHAALLISLKEGNYTAELKDPKLSLSSNKNIQIYYDLEGQFVRQSANIETAMGRSRQLITFRTQGDPDSAETREHIRIATRWINLRAEVQDSQLHPVIDISKTGFSLTCPASYPQDHILEITLQYRSRRFTGHAAVCSANTLANGDTRYGISCLNDQDAADELAEGVEEIFTDLQHRLLQRTTGAA